MSFAEVTQPMVRRVFQLLPWVTSACTMAVVMASLVAGAPSRRRAVQLLAAPCGKPLGEDGRRPLAWQVLVVQHGAGPDDVASGADTEFALCKHEECMFWRGRTRTDGIAEARLEVPRSFFEEPVRYAARLVDDAEGGVQGDIRLSDLDQVEARTEERPALAALARRGRAEMSVWIEGGKLVAGVPSTVWVRTELPPEAPDRCMYDAFCGLRVELAPEPGLDVSVPGDGPRCLGWTKLSAVSWSHAATLSVTLFSAVKPVAELGHWSGALPVGFGASLPHVPSGLRAGEQALVQVEVPSARSQVYAELYDEAGRVFGDLAVVDETGASRRATVKLPALAEGMHWFWVNGDPLSLGMSPDAPSTFASSLFALGDREPPVAKECLGPWAVRQLPRQAPRRRVADATVALDALARQNSRRATLVALLSLLVGALVQTAFLWGARRVRRNSTPHDAGLGRHVQSEMSRVFAVMMVVWLATGLLAALVWLGRANP